MERVVELLSAPIIGQKYMVPCIEVTNCVYEIDIVVPVMGKQHRDPVLGGQAAMSHIHIDQRFVTEDQMKGLFRRTAGDLYPNDETGYITVFAVASSDGETQRVFEVEKECLREMPGFTHRRRSSQGIKTYWHLGQSLDHFGRFEDTMDGKVLKGTCKVCPHHGIPLGSITPIDGVITCPGHFLDWDAKTGKRIRRTVKCVDDRYEHKDR